MSHGVCTAPLAKSIPTWPRTRKSQSYRKNKSEACLDGDNCWQQPAPYRQAERRLASNSCCAASCCCQTLPRRLPARSSRSGAACCCLHIGRQPAPARDTREQALRALWLAGLPRMAGAGPQPSCAALAPACKGDYPLRAGRQHTKATVPSVPAGGSRAPAISPPARPSTWGSAAPGSQSPPAGTSC